MVAADNVGAGAVLLLQYSACIATVQTVAG